MIEPTSALDSGLQHLDRDSIDGLPDRPGLFRLLSSGQRIMYVGAAGEAGLRETVRDIYSSQVMTGVSLIEYQTVEDADVAETAAAEQIEAFKPLYNTGFGRFRNDQTSLPKQGHRIRKAMNNP